MKNLILITVLALATSCNFVNVDNNVEASPVEQNAPANVHVTDTIFVQDTIDVVDTVQVTDTLVRFVRLP